MMLPAFSRQYTWQVLTAVVLSLMAINLLTVTARKSITIDETLLIPAGHYYLAQHNFQISHDQPPLPSLSAALPRFFLPIQVPDITDLSNQPSLEQTIPATQRFWNVNRENFESIFFWSRVPVILMTLALGVFIFVMTSELFSARAGALATALFSLEPTILGHGRVAKDIDVALAYLLFCFALHLYVSAPSLRRALLVGLVAGFALSVKFSMLIVFPIMLIAAGVLLMARWKEKRSRQIIIQLAASLLLALVVLNAAYLFQRQPLSAVDANELAQRFEIEPRLLLPAMKASSIFVPPYFLKGALVTFQHNDSGHPAFLLSEYSDRGWWYYFPVAFALKTTIPFLLISVAALAWAAWNLSRRRWKFLIVLLPMLLYALLAMNASINIGIRHFLPVFPFLFILSGALLDRLLSVRKNRALASALVISALLLSAFEAVRVYPNYIPYMNQLASRHPHWTYLSDSNLEWGDDAGELASYLKAKGETRVRAALLGGSITLPLYGVEYVDLLAPPEVKQVDTRYVALGASFLNGSTVPGWSAGSGRETQEQRVNFFARYRDRKPEAVFGDSIYLFREHE